MRRRANDRGAAAVEFALVLPLLVMLLLGIVDFSNAWYTRAKYAGAAREAARNMSINNSQPTAVSLARTQLGFADAAGITVTTCQATSYSTTAKKTIVTIKRPMKLISGPTITLTAVAEAECMGVN